MEANCWPRRFCRFTDIQGATMSRTISWWGHALLALVLMLSSYSHALPADSQLNFLLLEVRLDQTVLSDAIPAYDTDEHTLLPLGELARLLTIAIQTQPQEGTASGFVLSKDRGFSLNLREQRVTRAGVTEAFDPALVSQEADDLYVAISLLEHWLPVKLKLDRSSLLLQVIPLETLPLQARLRREGLAGRMSSRGIYEDPGYPQYDLPYKLLSTPYIDQTLATEFSKDGNRSEFNSRYTAHLAGDLLGMESSIYFSEDTRDSSTDIRGTLGRFDPDANLLGPLHASAYQFGSLTAPSIDNITRGITGHGVTLSNRPLTQPTQFDRQTLEGELTPGWDVELFYNDALVGFQQPNAEGQYRFEDLPLSYGRNDFRLVFHGPLGQIRVEQYSYSLAQSMVQPGEFQYNLSEHRDEDGLARSFAQFDIGLLRSLSASAGFITAPVAGVEHHYSTIGLRTFWQTLSLSADFIKDQDGGSLTEIGLQTRIGGLAVDASRSYMDDFKSDVFDFTNETIETRDTLRLSGAIPLTARLQLPVTIEAIRDEYESGRVDNDISARISAYAYRTAFTNTVNWRSFDGNEYAYGSFQISRRLRDISLRGQMNYVLGSDSEVSALALTADKFLANGYRMTMAVAHTFSTPETRYTAGLTKSLGRYGLGLNASYLDTGEIAVGLQLFLAMGRDPRNSDWLFDARSMANNGAASVRMFLDENNNGVMDTGEDPLPDVGFTVNGGRNKARTNAAGIAHINHLPIKQHVNVGVDTGTLIDPQWAPQVAGRSLVPRPGRVAELDFPVNMTTEIDGTVYLLENGTTRGIGDLRLELLNENYEVVAETVSSWDGFYIIPGVIAGEYWLRVSPEQLQRLGLKDTGTRVLTVSGDGSFVNGIDLLVAAPTKKTRR